MRECSSHTMCHVSLVTCHLSPVTSLFLFKKYIYIFLYIKFNNLVELVGGVSDLITNLLQRQFYTLGWDLTGNKIHSNCFLCDDSYKNDYSIIFLIFFFVFVVLCWSSKTDNTVYPYANFCKKDQNYFPHVNLCWQNASKMCPKCASKKICWHKGENMSKRHFVWKRKKC